jgi:RimJ/RimL family protein N-acetyltransferase
VRHDVTVEGRAFRLRPARAEDSPFVLSLRTDPGLSRFLHPVSGRLEDQLAWFRAYEARPGDWCWTIERRAPRGAELEGTVALYDVAGEPARGEWGRWVLRPGSPAAVESAWLVYRAAFEVLGLGEVYCRTVADNARVLSFHDGCGLPRAATLPGHFRLGGRSADAIEHRLSHDAWPRVRARLEPTVERLAALLERPR